VRWGEPVTAPKDSFSVEVPAAHKLAFMQAIYHETQRVDGKFEWVDIRFDAPLIPTTAQTATDIQR
jgi:hypothetical protein